MESHKSYVFTIVTNIVALSCLYIDGNFPFLGIARFAFWFLPLLFNINLIRPYLFKNKNLTLKQDDKK
jgi:hypothetical protein